MKLTFLLFPLLMTHFSAASTYMPEPAFQLPIEICDNGLDDDLDGLIDINDTVDCNCPIAVPQSLIPNPSFEDRTCCPQDRSDLDCAVDWIQASEPTTDYLHTCGWMGWPDLPPPTPFPDGEGCVGFRNGRKGGTGPDGNQAPNPNWKEYAGACLLSPLKAGTSYRFEFWVGFTKAFNSPPTSIAFYGSTDCVNLPFGVGNEAFGCPLNGFGWLELDEVFINGALEWKKYEINFTPSLDIYAIAIGPNCEQQTITTDFYYFFDNLVLADVSQFEYSISASGSPCDETFALNIADRDTLSYQWYHDGVALVGETGPTLTGIIQEGLYQVRLIGPNSCKITPAFWHKIPFYTSAVNATICRDAFYQLGQSQVTASGNYVVNLKTPGGCDSTVFLNLQVVAENVDTAYVKIFESETLKIGKYQFKEAGEYDMAFEVAGGCDSLVHLFLDYYRIYVPNVFSPNGDGFNDEFTIFVGEGVTDVLSLEVYDRWGGRVFSQLKLEAGNLEKGWDGTMQGKSGSGGVYAWKALLNFDDGKTREFHGTVTLIR